MKKPRPHAAKSAADFLLTHVNHTPWRDRSLLQLKLASEVAGVSPATLYKFAGEGKLKLRELGGRTLVDVKSLIALIDSANDWKSRKRAEEAGRRKGLAQGGARLVGALS